MVKHTSLLVVVVVALWDLFVPPVRAQCEYFSDLNQSIVSFRNFQVDNMLPATLAQAMGVRGVQRIRTAIRR